MIRSILLIFTSVTNNKVSIIIAVSKLINDKYKANNITKKVLETIDGNGGGQIDIAQITCNDITVVEKLPKIIEQIITK